MKTEKNSVELFFDADIYSAEALRLAAAVFESRASVTLVKAPGGVKASIPCGGAGLAGEFCNEALNQQCRVDLGLRNSRLASIISTKALLSAAGGKTLGK